MMKNGVNNGRKKCQSNIGNKKNCDWRKSALSMVRWRVFLTNLLMQSYNISLRAQKFCIFFATHFKHISNAFQTHFKSIPKTFQMHPLHIPDTFLADGYPQNIPKRESHDSWHLIDCSSAFRQNKSYSDNQPL